MSDTESEGSDTARGTKRPHSKTKAKTTKKSKKSKKSVLEQMKDLAEDGMEKILEEFGWDFRENAPNELLTRVVNKEKHNSLTAYNFYMMVGDS